MDIKPPANWRPPQPNRPVESTPSPVPPSNPSSSAPQKPVSTPPPLKPTKKKPKRSRLHVSLLVAAIVAGCLFIASVCAVGWYAWATGPRSNNAEKHRVVIQPGETATTIGKKLYNQQLIRSSHAFDLYTQLSGTRSKLQAGGYLLSANQSVSSIVEHLVIGKTDEFDITILPGQSLKKLREQFKKDGFSDSEIDEAFNAKYQHPLLATRPEGATLEGYIYPETYRMNADQSLQDLLKRSFDEMYKLLEEKNYLAAFSSRNLTIHQALTLGSIIQMEEPDAADQRQVAQVMYKRLGIGMMLGSDVTFVYAAELTGVEPSVSIDSPYNTRKYAGLPPGPIATMNASALDAVANPAPGEYLFFVAGDDGITRFSMTEQEHQANVDAHCKQLCQSY